MTPRERVQGTQRVLLAAVIAQALLWAGVAGITVITGAALLDWVIDLPREARRLTIPLAWLVAVAVALALLWRGRRARSLASTALWIEERIPSLQYALVTSVEAPSSSVLPLLAHQIDRVRWERTIVPRAFSRAIVPPAVALAVAVLVVIGLPREIVARVSTPRVGDAVERPDPLRPPRPSRLSPLVARVTPPAYAPIATMTLEDPHSIEALVGSRIELEGRGAADGINASIGDANIAATAREGQWRLGVDMPARPAALRLRDREFEHLIVLDARADSAPAMTMLAPQRDTILRTPTGRITVRGEARDALGLASTWLEYIISSGQGESFRFRSGVLARRAHGGARHATLEIMLPIDSLRLAPGDVVHVRLVARDRNPARDAGTGASETRVVRIARLGEYDSVAVEGAPPPEADTAALSQRMLILLTEALVRREPRLARDAVVRESRAIGMDQSRLRRRVGEIIFSRLTGEESAEHSHEEEERRGAMTAEELLRAAEEATAHGAGEPLDFAEGESPVVAINRPLLEAYNAMWAATGELNIGAPRRALPHMRAALAAIERAREAERVYLRGRPAAVVVDVNRARLAGKLDSVVPAGRTPLTVDTTSIPARRFARAALLAGRDRQAALDSLLLLRVELLETSPAGAAALGEVVAALRGGGDVAAALARARPVVAGPARTQGVMRPWSGTW